MLSRSSTFQSCVQATGNEDGTHYIKSTVMSLPFQRVDRVSEHVRDYNMIAIYEKGKEDFAYINMITTQACGLVLMRCVFSRSFGGLFLVFTVSLEAPGVLQKQGYSCSQQSYEPGH